MARPKKFRDVDEWYGVKTLVYETEIEEGNKIKFLDNRHFDNESEKVFWRGITIQRISKSRSGKWRYREKLNIPYKKFPDFCKIVIEINEKNFKTKRGRPKQN